MSEVNENSKHSGNAVDGRALKRMKLVYKDTSISFQINPEDYTQNEPNKASITQTRGGAWIDAWGAGIVEITLKGTTGFKGTGTSGDTGYNRWKELRGLFRSVYESVIDGESMESKEDLIQFYNFTDNEFWLCYPSQGGIELLRSKSRPNIYQYTINLWALRRMGQPQTVSGIIGNPNNSKGGGNLITSSNSYSSSQGGASSFSRNSLRNTQVDTTVVTNTKTKSSIGIQEDCLRYFTQLEPLIGGKAGKISPVTGYQSTQGITMQSSGTVSNVVSFRGEDLAEQPTLMLSEAKFLPRVSVETYNMYTAMRNYSPEVLSPVYSVISGLDATERVMQAVASSVLYDSTIYKLIVEYQPKSILTKSEVNYLKLILLESMMTYMELYRIYNLQSEITTTLTLNNISILLGNIRAMTLMLSLVQGRDTIYQRSNVSNELRKLEKIITEIHTNVVEYL